jgi:hypothetical protein
MNVEPTKLLAAERANRVNTSYRETLYRVQRLLVTHGTNTSGALASGEKFLRTVLLNASNTSCAVLSDSLLVRAVRSSSNSKMYSHSAGDPELKRLGQVAFYLATTLLIGSWIAVALRLWVRFRITKSPGRDDVAMVSTLV